MLSNNILPNSPGIILPLTMLKAWLTELEGKQKVWFDNKFRIKKNVVVENAADFARVCEEFMPNVCVH